MKRLLVDVLIVFSVSLVVSIVVTALWNLVGHRAGAVDWETSVRLAILLGIIVPWLQSRRAREQ